MSRPLISVVFTCKDRPELTELCLRRFVEFMPQPYELFISYDGNNPFTIRKLLDIGNPKEIITNPKKLNRFALINEALEQARGEYFMHLENDFFWVDESCLEDSLRAFEKYPSIDYIRFELLPFTIGQFDRFETINDHDFCWMKETTPYRFTFNPHIRKFKFINGKPFQTEAFGGEQPEKVHNSMYSGTSVCMTGDNFRHLGIYSEGRHRKEWYAERLFNKRGKKTATDDEILAEFDNLTDSALYRRLLREYLIG